MLLPSCRAEDSPQSGFVACMFLPSDPESVFVSFPASCVSWLMTNFGGDV